MAGNEKKRRTDFWTALRGRGWTRPKATAALPIYVHANGGYFYADLFITHNGVYHALWAWFVLCGTLPSTVVDSRQFGRDTEGFDNYLKGDLDGNK